ncbi:GntR family transcriptional regulator [Burkholderia multivorans]|uniref:GntR family transcriptional regulator n=1 Tax=Burkholderia multivorans TaxID=87883 RepID=A0ABD7LGQ2_9BURK|nr:GntR family transcriptional regulator [Burkholderia multivorans]SAK15279.1 GntR family transcriptional regulator [Burkholderia multivorans]
MREAIQRLEQEGLLETRKNRGAVVKSLSRHDVEEIYHLRMLLESDAIHRSVNHLDDDVITQAERADLLLGEATSAERQGALNREFHQILYLPCRNSRQPEMICALRGQIERYERLQHRLLSDTTAFQEEHVAILDACRQRKADAARSMTVSHLESAKDIGMKLVRN